MTVQGRGTHLATGRHTGLKTHKKFILKQSSSYHYLDIQFHDYEVSLSLSYIHLEKKVHICKDTCYYKKEGANEIDGLVSKLAGIKEGRRNRVAVRPCHAPGWARE